MPRKKTFSTKRCQTAAEFRRRAMVRLREKWEEGHDGEKWEPENEPIVTPMLKSVEGGIAHVIESLRAHEDDDVRSFFDVYDACSLSDRRFLLLEAIAFASGIGSLRLAEVAQTALYLYASAQTKMLISTAMPKVTRSIIKAATDELPIMASFVVNGEVLSKEVGRTNGDVKAMDLFGRMSGIVPVPKGAQIAIQNNFCDRESEKPESATPAWRDSGVRLREFQDMTDPKRLPSPATKPMSSGGHVDALQEETIHILRGE